MIEYDLPFERECQRCFGAGYIISKVKMITTRRNPYEVDCVVCNGEGYMELPELELEDK